MRTQAMTADEKPKTGKPVLQEKDRRVVVGRVAVYQGHNEAELVQEVDPRGKLVTHARVVDADAIDWMWARGTITRAEWMAGDRFRTKFNQAGMRGRYRAIKYDDSPRGPAGPVIDLALDAKAFVSETLRDLPERCRAPVWFVIGEQMAIRAYVNRVNISGMGRTSRKKAATDIRSALEKMSDLYGLNTTRGRNG